VKSGNWNSSSEEFLINVDGLTVGWHFYSINVTDVAGNTVSDGVYVTVSDGTTPTIDSPADVYYDFEDTGFAITWNPSDTNPSSYEIFQDEISIESGSWNSSSEAISTIVDGLNVGPHNYTILVEDVSGNTISDTVFVYVADIINPTINSPADITYEYGDVGYEIVWYPSDGNPYSHELYRDTTLLQSGAWDGGSFTISVDGLEVGTYVFILTAYDVSNNWVSDSVTVTVNAVTTTPTETTDTTTTTTTTTFDDPGPIMVVAGAGGGIAIIVILGLVMAKKRKGGPGASVDSFPPPDALDPLSSEATTDGITEMHPDALPSEAVAAAAAAGLPLAAAAVDSESKDVQVLRGCAPVGGRFEYKVKIKNNTESVITNVTVTIVAYPDDCMELSGPILKSVKRIEPEGFRSPQFVFVPTKDCVEGRIIATVSYLDHRNKTQMLSVEPYVIRSVCDLLLPVESTMQNFDQILRNMEGSREEHKFSWNPEVLFDKVKKFLPARNFNIIEAEASTEDGMFSGVIKGLAEGKYTGKKVAIRINITGNCEGNESSILFEVLGDDVAMVPTTFEEIFKGVDSWTCMNCGGALEIDEVNQVKSGRTIKCRYCEKVLTIDLYQK